MANVGATHDQGPIDDHTQPTDTIHLPAPTAWPMVFALGIRTDAGWNGDPLGDQPAGVDDGRAGESWGGSSRCCRTSIT